MTADSGDRRLLVGGGLFVVGNEAIEVDVGPDLLKSLAIGVLGIDLKHLHDQRVNVLDVEVEAHNLVGTEFGLVREGKVEIDAILDRLVIGRRKERIPRLRVTEPADDFRFGEGVLEVVREDVGRVRVVVGRIDKKMIEIASHERLVVADGGEHREPRIVLAEIHGVQAVGLDLKIFGFGIPRLPWQLEVRQKPISIKNPAGAVEDEPVVEDMGLE